MSIERYEHSTELALSTTQDVAVQRLGEWAQSADAAYGVAQRLSESSFVPQQFRGKPVELCAAILSGLEVGLSPMAAMRSFDIIQGQAAPRAVTLRAVVQSHGHEMVLEESTATRCRMKGKRRGSNEWQRVVWTMDRARDLGLATKDGWKKQPTAMLVARATSELARLIASDAILGIAHSAEEIADGATFDQQVDAETAMPSAPSGTRRMGRNLAPVEDHPEPDDIEPDDDDASPAPRPAVRARQAHVRHLPRGRHRRQAGPTGVHRRGHRARDRIQLGDDRGGGVTHHRRTDRAAREPVPRGPGMTRSRRRTRAEWDEHLSGVRALHDGVCLRCPEPILRDQRVTRHRDGWIHVQCASGH
jgi:hypothetical protein